MFLRSGAGLYVLIEHIPVHPIGPEGVGAVADHPQAHAGVVPEEVRHGLQGHMGRLGQGIAVYPGADGGEIHRAAAVGQGQLQAAEIAAAQQGSLPVAAALPDGAGGVDHIAAGQVIGPGELGMAGFAAPQGAALGQQAGPGGPVDGPVHPQAPQQGGVGGVDDGVHGYFRDVIANDDKGHIVYRLHSSDLLKYCSRIHSVLQWTLGCLIVLIDNSSC